MDSNHKENKELVVVLAASPVSNSNVRARVNDDSLMDPSYE
jgi:hypothetical protein